MKKIFIQFVLAALVFLAGVSGAHAFTLGQVTACTGFVDQGDSILAPIGAGSEFQDITPVVMAFVDLQNIDCDHRFAVDVYLNGQFFWNRPEEEYRRMNGSARWEHSYFNPWLFTAGGAAGDYTAAVKLDVDDGRGFQPLTELAFTVVSTKPDYILATATACLGYTPGEAEWSQVPVSPGNTFIVGSTVFIFVELTDLRVTHRFKAVVTTPSTTWDPPIKDPDWRVIAFGSYWGYSYFTPSFQVTESGAYTATVFLDAGAGYRELTAVNFQVVKPGDVNDDGKVNQDDANCFLKALVGLPGATSSLMGGSRVTHTDALKTLQRAAGRR